MIAWFLGKMARCLLTVIALVSFVFCILRATGDPALAILGPEAPLEALEAYREAWGLNLPLYQQYLMYWANILRLDFGDSMIVVGSSAFEVVLSAVPATLSLMLPTAILTLLIGIPAGILAASHKDSGIDRVSSLFTTLGFCIPNFIVGIILIWVFVIKLGWLNVTSGRSGFESYLLPVITMVTAEAAIFMKFTRAAMIEELAKPYISFVRSKGICSFKQVYFHALPNASIAIISMGGIFIGGIISGAVITETVFSWPGMGSLLVKSILFNDLAVVQLIIIIIGVTMSLSNLMVDFITAMLNPKTRYFISQGSSKH